MEVILARCPLQHRCRAFGKPFSCVHLVLQIVVRLNAAKYKVSISPAGNALLLSFLSSKRLSTLTTLLSQHVALRVVDSEDTGYVASHGVGEDTMRRYVCLCVHASSTQTHAALRGS